ncbi:MAG TPA: tetratricopeptide repeat protein [Thermodesulfovibrionales bacterium]|nr:tetratricopeptide repeat protein [Thermodesulfovibrionales bacterium]
MNPRKDSLKTAVFFPVAVIALVAFGVYFDALSSGFILDDYAQVLKNPVIRDLRNIPEVFLRSAWTFEGAPPTSNYYRPMLNLLYMVIYRIFGIEAWGFHFVSVLFHIGVSILVFVIASGLFGAYMTRRAGEASPPARRFVHWDTAWLLTPPFIAALLFAVHPIHTEAVTWIAGLSDVSMAFFYLLSFHLYVRSRGNYTMSYVVSVLSFLFAVLCKEPGLTLPGILIAYDYLFEKRTFWSLHTAARYAAYLLVVCCYVIVRFHVLGGLVPLKRLGGLSASQYAMNVFPVLSRYLHQLILPVNLNFWPVYNPITSLLTTEGMASLFFVLIIAVSLVIALKKNNLVFLSLLLILVPLVPALYVKGIAGKLYSERYLYLPSFGFVMLIAFFFVPSRFSHPEVKRGLLVVIALLLGVYAMGTISRNTVWRDEQSLFRDTVQKSPNSVVPRFELGNALLMEGRWDEAIEQYRTAARLEPNLYVIHHHLGLALAAENRLFEAVEQYQGALLLNPDRAQIHEDLGRALAEAGFKDLAIGEFKTVLALQPSAAHYDLLGVAYAQRGQMKEAVSQFRMASYLAPANARYARDLAEASERERSAPGRRGDELTHRWEYEDRILAGVEIFSFVW